MLQCVAVCCIVLQCVAVCCSVLQCAAVCYSVLQCVAVCCSVSQCVAVCCSVLQCVAVYCSDLGSRQASVFRVICILSIFVAFVDDLLSVSILCNTIGRLLKIIGLFCKILPLL